MLKALARAALSAAFGSTLLSTVYAQSIAPMPAVANKDAGIWWAPRTWSLNVSDQIDYTANDFPELLSIPGEWPMTRGDISVLELPGNLVWSYPVSPGGGPLSTLVHWVNNHPRKKLSFGSGFVANGGACGVGIEGESSDAVYNVETGVIARLWAEAGGRLDYWGMDSPLLYARIPVSQGGCGWTIQHVAENVSETMKAVQKYFPDIRFIDGAGPAFEPTASWLNDMQQFHSELAALGTPVYATHLDVGWETLLNDETYTQIVSQAVPFFHLLGEHVGLILDADATSVDMVTTKAWLGQYAINAQTIANGHFGEDWVSVESWIDLPQYSLPEWSPTSFASVVPMLQKLLHPVIDSTAEVRIDGPATTESIHEQKKDRD